MVKEFQLHNKKLEVYFMQNYSMALPHYSIGPAIYDDIVQFCSPHGKKIIAIGGHKAMAAARPLLTQALAGSELKILDFLWYGGEASYENVAQLQQHQLVQEADMIFAIGGGKALDTCKCLSVKLQKPVFTFPTIASTCAAVTTVAVMYHPDGSFCEPFYFLQPPVHAFINTAVIAAAPSQYLWAGLGDTYAKYYETTVSSRGDTLTHYNALGVQMSRQCLEPLLQYGQHAMEDNKQQRCTYALEQVVLAVIVTTGLVSILVTREHTADYNSGLAHSIFYAMTTLPEFEKDHLHGAVVGFGVLLLLLCDGQLEEFERLYQFNRAVGLPVSLQELQITPEQMEALYPLIPKIKDVQHYPYPITVSMLKQAFRQLAQRNQQDKAQ